MQHAPQKSSIEISKILEDCFLFQIVGQKMEVHEPPK